MVVGQRPSGKSRFGAEDGARVSTDVGAYSPNEAGVCDLIGNVAEWTMTAWKPPAGTSAPPQVVAKGGGWRDRPKTATPFSRMPARPEMKFADVGFRVIIEDEVGKKVASSQ